MRLEAGVEAEEEADVSSGEALAEAEAESGEDEVGGAEEVDWGGALPAGAELEVAV